MARRPQNVRIAEAGAEQSFAAIIDARIEQARLEGIAEGEQKATLGAAAALGSAIDALEALHKQLTLEAGQQAVELAMATAGHLLQAEVESERYNLEEVVRQTLSESGAGRRTCTVHLHPKDAERLAEIEFRSGTTIEADPNVARGDVQVSTPDGLFVRDIEHAIRSIGERILGDLR